MRHDRMAAVAAAAAVGRTLVYVGSGTYNETVVLSSGVTLQGGWTYAGGGAWQPVCSGDVAAVTVIKGTDGGGVIGRGQRRCHRNGRIAHARDSDYPEQGPGVAR